MFYFIFILLFSVVDLQSTLNCPADTVQLRAAAGAGAGDDVVEQPISDKIREAFNECVSTRSIAYCKFSELLSEIKGKERQLSTLEEVLHGDIPCIHTWCDEAASLRADIAILRDNLKTTENSIYVDRCDIMQRLFREFNHHITHVLPLLRTVELRKEIKKAYAKCERDFREVVDVKRITEVQVKIIRDQVERSAIIARLNTMTYDQDELSLQALHEGIMDQEASMAEYLIINGDLLSGVVERLLSDIYAIKCRALYATRNVLRRRLNAFSIREEYPMDPRILCSLITNPTKIVDHIKQQNSVSEYILRMDPTNSYWSVERAAIEAYELQVTKEVVADFIAIQESL